MDPTLQEFKQRSFKPITDKVDNEEMQTVIISNHTRFIKTNSVV